MTKTIGSFDLASLKNLRDDVTQYFWFESDSSSAWGSGAHVTLYPESQFTDSTNPNYMKGQNIIMNTDGFSIRNGGLPMMVLDNDSLDFNAIDITQGTYVTIATFGLTGATIGQTNGAHSIIDANGQRFYASDGTTQLANIGYSEGQGESGTTIAPYYTFGIRDVSNGIGNYSIAEGINTSPRGYASHAEGSGTITLSHYAHAEGEGTRAYQDNSHAEGLNTIANGKNSHAEGYLTHTQGDNAHAEGSATHAYAKNSHAQGEGTHTEKRAQTVLGTSNIHDTSSTTTHPNGIAEYGQYALIIGNGDVVTPSNALTVDWVGNVKSAGDITDGSGNVLSSKQAKLVSGTNIKTVSGTSLLGSGNVAPKSFFSVENQTWTSTIGASTYADIEKTFTKSGYYPLGVTGFSITGTSSTTCYFTRCYTSSRSNGSVTVTIRIRNTSSTPASGATVGVTLLWVEI